MRLRREELGELRVTSFKLVSPELYKIKTSAAESSRASTAMMLAFLFLSAEFLTLPVFPSILVSYSVTSLPRGFPETSAIPACGPDG
jgi:hypothetical protein